MKTPWTSELRSASSWLRKNQNWSLSSLVLVVLALILLGQFQRVQLTANTALYIHDLVISAYILLVAFYYWQPLQKRLRSLQFRTAWPWCLLLGWIVIGWFRAAIDGAAVATACLYAARYLTYTLFLVSLFKLDFLKVVIQGKTHRQTLTWLMVITGVGLLVTGLLQYVFLPDTRFLHILGWDDHYYRLIGTQFDPNFMGGIFFLFFLLHEAALRGRTYLRLSLQSVFILGLALTFSRSSYLAFGVALMYLALIDFLRGKTRASFKWIGMLFILGVFITLAPKPTGEGVRLGRTSTVISRLDRTEGALNDLSSTDLILGKGLLVPLNLDHPQLENQEIPNHSLFTDNLLVNLFVGLGAGGLLLLGVIAVFQLRVDLNNELLVAAWIGILAHSVFNNTLLQPFVWIIFGIIIGIFNRTQLNSQSKLDR